MRNRLFALALSAVICNASLAAPQPNFLVIVADDLGFSDLGAFGGDIDTPNLNKLALSGIRFTNFHAAATCSPTRAMLLSGVDHHRAGLGTMNELLDDAQRGKPGYEGYLNRRVVTIAELLHDAGYSTLMSGKWHLGEALDQDPSQRGFEHSFALEEAGHDHFGKLSVIDGLPAWLDRGVRGFFRLIDRTLERVLGHSNMLVRSLRGFTYREDGRDVTLPADFYSSDFFAGKMIDYLREHAQREPNKPFFAYLAFTAPHFPLQAPPQNIAKYHGRYADGWSALRDRRIAAQQQLGLIAQRDDIGRAAQLDDWNALTPEQQARSARAMEIYAGMVDRLDWNVGRVLEQLRAQGALDNTVIVFLSDNGAEGADARITVKDVAGISLPEEPIERMGTRGTFDSYGPNWAQAAMAPARLYKATTAEGGILVPAFIAGGAAVADSVGGRGAVSHSLVTVRDVLPTLLDLAQVPRPQANYRGREIIPPSGVSLLPLLHGEAIDAHPADELFGWEIFGQRALRRGDWKIVWITPPRGPGRWQLFDLANDPGETRDLAAQQPDILRELIRGWDDYVAANGLVLETKVVGQPMMR